MMRSRLRMVAGDVPDLVASGLALPECAAEALEGFAEELLNVVGLKASGLGAFHVLTDLGHAAGSHEFGDEGAIFHEPFEVRAVDGGLDGLREAGLNLGILAVADSPDEQVA